MLKIFLLINLICVISFLSFGQDNKSDAGPDLKRQFIEVKKHRKICSVEIIDTALISAINMYVYDRIQIDSAFSNSGYVTLRNKEQPATKHSSSNKICFSLSASYLYFYDDQEEGSFPLYYTYVNKKLVLIFDWKFSSLYKFALKRSSKRKFVKLTESYLPPKDIQYVEGLDGRKMKLVPSGTIVLHGDKTVCL